MKLNLLRAILCLNLAIAVSVVTAGPTHAACKVGANRRAVLTAPLPQPAPDPDTEPVPNPRPVPLQPGKTPPNWLPRPTR